MWRVLDPLHAVTYFAPECDEEFRASGLKGFWMGYFAGRSAPMGAVEPAVTTATFYNFAPRLVQRACPTPGGSPPGPGSRGPIGRGGAGLRPDLRIRGRGGRNDQGGGAGPAGGGERHRGGAAPGRGQRRLAWPDHPGLVLWQATTVLREHRGDGHVAALVDAGLDGVEAHISLVGTGAVPRSVLQPARGWTDEEWEAAERSMVERGWLQEKERDTLTAAGATTRQKIEDATDRLAVEPWATDGGRGHRGVAGAREADGHPDRRARLIPRSTPSGSRPRPQQPPVAPGGDDAAGRIGSTAGVISGGRPEVTRRL